MICFFYNAKFIDEKFRYIQVFWLVRIIKDIIYLWSKFMKSKKQHVKKRGVYLVFIQGELAL